MQYRNEFPRITDLEGRKQMAKEEFDAWDNYLQERKQDLPKPDFEIEDKDLSLVKENFDRFKVALCFNIIRIEKPTRLHPQR